MNISMNMPQSRSFLETEPEQEKMNGKIWKKNEVWEKRGEPPFATITSNQMVPILAFARVRRRLHDLQVGSTDLHVILR